MADRVRQSDDAPTTGAGDEPRSFGEEGKAFVVLTKCTNSELRRCLGQPKIACLDCLLEPPNTDVLSGYKWSIKMPRFIPIREVSHNALAA
jgi:hypothetical protein